MRIRWSSIHLLAYCFVWLACLSSVPAQAAPIPYGKGLLWQIEKAGSAPSYLFGTIHSEDPRVLELPEAVSERLQAATSFSLEIQLDSSLTELFMERMFLPEGKKLARLIGTEAFLQTFQALSEHGLPFEVVSRLQPWAATLFLSTPPVKTGQYLDLILYERAKSSGKALHGLETADEQLAIFESFSTQDQIKILKETLKNQDGIKETLEATHILYLQRDLAGLQELMDKQVRASKEKKLNQKFMKRLVDDRNRRMAERMQPRLQEGNAFIAVGALHLPGTKGILKILEKQGYTLSLLY
jgi:uncharacterized protein YbaP (TraB family)